MIILGSSSPRRIELIKTLTNNFKVIKPFFDESTLDKSSFFYLHKISRYKLKSILNLINYDDFVICLDTVIKFKNKILTKPLNKLEAINDLRLLSNKKHLVITSVTYKYKNRIHIKLIKTKVYFNKLSNDDILTYLNEVYVYDKAGSYAIQDKSSINLIKKIKGSYTNVIGFPIEYIEKLFKKYKLIN